MLDCVVILTKDSGNLLPCRVAGEAKNLCKRI